MSSNIPDLSGKKKAVRPFDSILEPRRASLSLSMTKGSLSM
jgi:hypothetical protein